jgi:hypothetical protein
MATATIQVAYEAETTSLKATVNEINQINDKVVQGAQESASKVKKEYTGIANSFAAAFSSGQAKKALDNQAKAIDNVGKSGKSLVGQLRGLKQELSALEIAGQDGTAAFNQLLIAAAKLEDQIGDTRARVKILASDTFKFDAAVGATQALASGFELAQGAATLFGAESEDLQKAIAKVTAATAVANGVQQLSSLIKEESAVKTAALNILERINAASVRQSALSYNILGTSVQFSARTLNIFKGALAATGIGAAVIAIGILIDVYKDFQDSTAKSAQALKDITNANQELAVKTIEAQEQLDLALGKISERQVERNIATRKFASELLEIQLANNKRLVANEEATNKAIFLSRAANIAGFLAPALQAKLAQDIKKLEQERVQITDEANKQIDTARKNFSLERQKAEIEANKEDKKNAVDAAKEKAEAVIKVERTYQEINGQLVLAESKKRFADVAVLEAQLNLLRNKDSIEAQQQLIKAKLKADLLGYELEYQAALKQNIDLDAAKADYLAKVKLAEQTAANDIVDINKEKNDEIADDDEEALNSGEKLRRYFNKKREDDEKEETENNKKETDKRIELAFQYAKAVTSLFGQLNELSKQASEQRIADITAQSEKELEAINATTDLERDKERQRAALAKRTAQAISAEKTKQAKQDKALALFNIGISTAEGIVSALATKPPNPILAAFIAVTGALQLAAVAAKPIPKFERGGVVGGRLHSSGGTMVEAERDEYIVNRRQSMRHRRELDAINNSSDAFRKLIEQRYVRPALMDYVAGNRSKQGVTVNASLNSKSMEKEMRGMRKDLKSRNVTININQQDSRYVWQ